MVDCRSRCGATLGVALRRSHDALADGCPADGPIHSVTGMTSTASPPRLQRRRPLGLPFLAIVGLALLAAVRAVLHDLGIVHEGSFVNLLLVVVPLLAWVAVVVWARVPNPFLTVLVIGACYGVLLAGVHQVFWTQAFDGSPPALGGNFSGLDLEVRLAVPRVAAVFSSLFTGVAIGAILGLIAWALSKAVDRRARTS